VPAQSAMPFRWTVNPYRGCTHACVYCFARPTHRYLGFDAGRDFEREIVVKINAPELLERELARPSWAREHVALGTNTDPYQWVEARYKLMPGIWRALLEHRTPCSVLTKSPLVLRDLPLLAELAAEGLFGAALSVPTLDERAWRATEPHTPHPAARLEAVAKLAEAGIPTSVLVAPLMPGINDDPASVAEIVRRAREAGARSVTPLALHLRSGVREVFMDWLERERPELVGRYGEIYARGAYAPADERRRLTALVRGDRPRGAAARFGRQRPEPPPAPARTEHARTRAPLAQASLF
jgi:DNA repair photolyase